MKLPHEAKKVFTGELFDVYQWEQELFDGSKKTYEMLKRSDSVNIIAVSEGKIIIIDDDQPARGKITCIPAGRVEPSEKPEDAAPRELLEETGFTSDDWQMYLEEQPYSKIEWTNYTLIARNAKKRQDARPDAGERIETTLISFDDFLNLARDPHFRIPNSLRHVLWEVLLNPNKKAELKRELGL